MGGFERRQCPLTRHGAAPVVDIGHKDPEGALAEARPDQGRFTIARLTVGHTRVLRPVHTLVDRIPQRKAFGMGGVVGLE